MHVRRVEYEAENQRLVVKVNDGREIRITIEREGSNTVTVECFGDPPNFSLPHGTPILLDRDGGAQ